MSIAKHCIIAAVALLTFPLLLSAQKPAKPPAPGGTAANPAIAYEAKADGNSLTDLMVMDANGQNQTRLVRGGNNLTPRWSPDGEWIAFARTSVTSPGIYMIRRNGTGLCRIVATSGLDRFGAPTWSPEPTVTGHHKIVYVDRTGGQTTDLFAVDAVCGAANPQRLTDTPSLYERSPAWSSDNVLGAAVGPVALEIQLYDIVLDGVGGITLSPALNLTSVGPLTGVDVSFPLWTADRRDLVVSSGGFSVGLPPSKLPPKELWLISANSPGIAIRLTSTADSFELRPTWSPDFTKLAFDNGNSIYTVDVNATDWTLSQPTLLLKPRQGWVTSPSWRPVQ